MQSQLLLIAILLICRLSTSSAAGQTAGEVIARVNGQPISRSEFVRQLKQYREELAYEMHKQNRSEAEIDTELASRKRSVLDTMIDDLLLEQKAKELGYESEAEKNREALEGKIGCVIIPPATLEQELKKHGIDAAEARASLRKKWLRQYLIQREVLLPIFESLTEQERRQYYEQHHTDFMTQSEFTLSEIFLPLAGRSAIETQTAAQQLARQVRGGSEFAKAVKENTPAARASYQTEGRLGKFKLDELRDDIAQAVSNLKPGEVADPILMPDGYQIIRVEESRPATLRDYHDPKVQEEISRAITMQRAEGATKEYTTQLRQRAVIEIRNY